MSPRTSTKNADLDEKLASMPHSSEVSSPHATVASISPSIPSTKEANLPLPPRSTIKQFNISPLLDRNSHQVSTSRTLHIDGNDDDSSDNDDGYIPAEAEYEANETRRPCLVGSSTPVTSPVRALADPQSRSRPSPSNPSLPLPLAVTQIIFNTKNPGLQEHREWTPLSAHTAKCDNCNKHNKGVIQRCKSCNRQLCKTCMATNTDGVHCANMDELNWTPPPQPSRPKSKRKAITRRKATTPHLQSPSSSKVTKTTATLARKTRNSGGLGTLLDLPVHCNLDQPIFVDKSCRSGQRYGFDRGSDTEEDPVPLTQDFVQKEHELYKMQSQSIHDKTKGPDKGSHPCSSLENCAAVDSGFETGMSSMAPKRPGLWQPMSSAGFPAASAEMNSGTSHSVLPTRFPAPDDFASGYTYQTASCKELGCPMPGEAIRSQNPFKVPAGLAENFHGNSFSEALVELKKLNDAQEEREKERAVIEAKERAYEDEKTKAWDTDPTITALRNSGKINEALGMLEIAAILIRSKRGLT